MKILFLAALAVTAVLPLYGDDANDRRIDLIYEIAKVHFERVVNPHIKRDRDMIYANVNDPKLRNAVYAEVKKKSPPFETRTKLVWISGKANQEINRLVTARFPNQKMTPEERAARAADEARLEFPLAKVGDEVTVRYFRNRIYGNVTGKIKSIRNDGQVFEINNRLIHVADIVPGERKYFDARLNDQAREEFRNYYRDNFDKFKREYRARLVTAELEQVEANAAAGYVFFRGSWRTAKFVADAAINYYKGVTTRRFQMDQQRMRKRPASKKK